MNMALHERQIRLWLWIATSTYLIIFFLDSLWSTSIDLMDHITYVGKILDNWTLSAAASWYPLPLYGHAIAAVLAAPFSSPIVGVQLATLLSLVGLWSGFALIFQTLQRRMLVHVSIALLVLLALNRYFFRLELHGNEVIVNFFFSHLIAEAVAVIVIALVLMIERSGGRPEQKYFLLALSIPVVECLHLLPALQLLGVLALLAATDFFALPKQSRFRTLGTGALLTVLSVIGIALHPTFAPSVTRASADDAGLSLLRTPDIKTLAILCLVVGLLSSLLLVKWLHSVARGAAWRNGLAVKYVALYGLSNAGLCLFQILLRLVGYGSEYVCKKYAFALNTTLVFELALLIGLLLNPRWLEKDHPAPTSTARLYDVAFMSLFLLAAFFAVLPKDKRVEASELATVERFARMYTQTAFHNAPGTFNYAVGLNLPGTDSMNYFITVEALNAPPAWADANTQDVYLGRPFSQPSLVAHILTSANAKPWDIQQCRTQFSSASLVVLDGQCVISALRNKCVGRVDFSINGDLALFSSEGFSEAEEKGRWTDGPQASFICEFPTGARKDDRSVEITASGYAPSGKPQRVLLSVNGAPSRPYEFDKERTITIQLPPGKDQLTLDFALPDAVSPKELGVGNDLRKIAIFVRSISFGP